MAVRKGPQTSSEWLWLSDSHVACARLLLDHDLTRAQSYFHAGIAVECALKGFIMRSEGLMAWPTRAERRELYTHDLERLLDIAELDHDQSGETRESWRTVLQWGRLDAYDPTPLPLEIAKGMFDAVTGRKGVLAWLSHTDLIRRA